MYPACLLAVVVLYALIYRSVLRRRYKRQREKRKTLALVRTAQQEEDQRQRQVETPSPDGRAMVAAGTMVELAVDVKTTTEAFDDSTLTTDINGCITLLPVRDKLARSSHFTAGYWHCCYWHCDFVTVFERHIAVLVRLCLKLG